MGYSMGSFQNMWMLLILPLMAGFFTVIPKEFFSWRPKNQIILFVTLFSLGISLLLTLLTANSLSYHTGGFFESNFLFLDAGGFKIHMGILLDNISVFMLIVLYLLSIPSIVFSYKYIENKEGFSKYFALLNIFLFSITGLILSSNLIQTFIFWELTGLLGYITTGFFNKFQDKDPSKTLLVQNSARNMFFINRIGDVALLLAVLWFVFFSFQDTESILYPLLSLNDVNSWGLAAYVQLGSLSFMGVCLLIIIAALVKSAQIPFQSWVLDTVETPIHLNALIHGALTIGMGAYLLIRLYPALLLSHPALIIITVIGVLTTILCAIMAFIQSDIKKVLALCCSAQTGFILIALGCGAYSGAVFQLGTNTIALGLMFLLTAVIIQKTGERNFKLLGGLREFMPAITAFWIIGSLSLTGMFFTGFYAKEMILGHLYTTEQFSALYSVVFAGILSVLYLARTYFFVFEGPYKGDVQTAQSLSKGKNKKYDNLNRFFFAPITFLAVVCALFGGFIAHDFQRYIYIMRQKFYIIRHPEVEIPVFILSAVAIYIMWQIYYVKRPKLRKIRFIYRLIVLQFYINRFFTFTYNLFIKAASKIVKTVDRYIIGGLCISIGQIVRFGAYLVSRLQNGSLNSYLLYTSIFLTMILFAALTVYFRGLYGG